MRDYETMSSTEALSRQNSATNDGLYSHVDSFERYRFTLSNYISGGLTAFSSVVASGFLLRRDLPSPPIPRIFEPEQFAPTNDRLYSKVDFERYPVTLLIHISGELTASSEASSIQQS